MRYVGPVIGEPKRRLLETSDFSLLPTMYFTKGQPLAIIEAIAYGCVVISTDYRAILYMVVDGISGGLIEAGRIAAFIREIIVEPDRYEEVSQAAVDRYEKFFTMQRHLDAIIPLLKT